MDGPQPLHAFYQQTLPAVKKALGDLLQAKTDLQSKNIPGVEKMFPYIEALSAVAEEPESTAPRNIQKKEMLRFLQLDLVPEFIANPENQEVRDMLGLELMYISAAVGFVATNIEPYSVEEMEGVLEGTADYYSDVTLLYTLQHLLQSNMDTRYGGLLANNLNTASGQTGVPATYYWDEAILLGMFLHTTWKFFPILERSAQEFVLRNYWFLSVAAGVPVRFWLKLAALDQVVTIRLLENNTESVPLSARATGSVGGEMISNCIATVSGAQISVLAQEKFIDSLYKNTPVDKTYRAWLREALATVIHLKDGDL